MLRNEGVSDETIDILVEEEIRTVNVFTSLREEHFGKLLPKMKVGHHALLNLLKGQDVNWMLQSLANSEHHVLMPMNASKLPNTCVACPWTSSAKESHGLSPKALCLSTFTSLVETWSRISDSRGHTTTTTAEPLDALLQEQRKLLEQEKIWYLPQFC